MQLLTTTGARPVAWRMCREWMKRQTYTGAVHWIIVDDGQFPQSTSDIKQGWDVTVIRPEPHWKPGQNTQYRNLLAGLEVVDDYIPLAIIEDDDWYHPEWLSHCSKIIRDKVIAGESNNRYYNIRDRTYKRHLNAPDKASLCATVMVWDGTKALREQLQTGRAHRRFVDMSLWAEVGGGENIAEVTEYTVGIKGYPGRGGIGGGHRKGEPAMQPDPNCARLFEWVGVNDGMAMLEAIKEGVTE